MRRATAIRTLVIAALALSAVAPAMAASARPYDHRWAAEAMYAGDAGATSVTTIEDSVSLKLAKGVWLGTITYSDVMGLRDASGAVASQVSRMSLTLEGSTLEAGSSIGGRFDGTVTLVTSSARSLDEASSPAKADAPGLTAVYDVSGFWAAQLDGDKASGQLYFQSARPEDGSKGEIHEADWFNRISEANPEGMGDPQPFSVIVQGVSTAPGSSKPSVSRPVAQPSKPAARPSVFSYVRKGILGTAISTPLPITAEAAAAARALRDATPTGATALPSGSVAVDVDVAGSVLDAKNRAVGLLGVNGPTGPGPKSARKAFDAMVAATPLHAAPRDDEDAGLALAKRLTAALGTHPGTPGAAALGADAQALRPGADPATVSQLRAWVAVAEALAGEPPASTLRAVRALARTIAEKPVPRSGPFADAILAAADSPRAPETSVRVAAFRRDPSLDTSTTASGRSPVQRALAVQKAQGQTAPAIMWTEAGADRSASPSLWLAYRRADGTLFWLAGEGGAVAVREAGVHGWAWNGERAAVVDAGLAGRVLSEVELATP